jgi:hypothetical protein
MSPEIRSRIAILQQKAIAGTLTIEEMREGVQLMRADRVAGASASDSSRRAKAKAVIKSADEMLDELGGI